ncbi:hypothetical protein LUZ60_016772 [Juncus effusus]|nr:hypothetical protein LUZ60_016772 [Juncus effusus]
MKSKNSSFLLSLCVSFLVFSFGSRAVGHDVQTNLQTYIVFVQAPSNIDISISKVAEDWHTSILSTFCKDSASSRFIYSYNTIANGFAARLSEDEVEAMSKEPWFVRAVLANKPYKLTTTHSPEFLHLRGPNGFWKNTNNMGKGMIIGVLDTGISPGHPSFDDTGMAPPPAKWKGHCDFNKTVCNNKLIGAKSFFKAGGDELKHISPFDVDEHGTHTSSTAAGAFVKTTNILGNALGSPSGMAPRAHLAIYRVCADNCSQADVFKGMEEAVNDGCDVLSLSLGSGSDHFYRDPISLGGFLAILKGVFVSTAAGNEGPMAGTLSNEAPWLLTVAASTTDRQIQSIVKLGNGLQLKGESLYQPKIWKNNMLPLVYLGAKGDTEAGQCINETVVKSEYVRGKIVVCDRGGNGRVAKGQVVLKAGGIGMVLVNQQEDGYSIGADNHVLPASHISYDDGQKLKSYIGSTKQPVATFLFEGVKMHNSFSPSIASFSSRGPNREAKLIMKPDITGPGVGIVAAVPPKVIGQTTVQFDFMSGTSMATPHLSGIAALIKKAHPSWSPAAIKSALMTTAYVTDLDGKPITDEKHLPANVLNMGSGHVNPDKALDPGLIYDITPEDYIKFLCGLGYTDKDINSIIHPAPPVQCVKVKSIPQEQLNYPSIAAPLSMNGTAIIQRTVTNVGKARATYKAVVNAPKEFSVKVKPAILKFKSVNEKKNFKIVFKYVGGNAQDPFGELKWISSRQVVRSPIVIVLQE